MSDDDSEREQPAPAEQASPTTSPDLVPIVGANLRKLRMKRGLSLERLAKASGVSRAMLGQIELAQSAPTINVMWRIAHALDVPFSALISVETARGTSVLRQTSAKRLTSHDGKFTSRALFPFDQPRRTEFYELRLAPGAIERADAHTLGTVENLVVARGAVVIDVSGERHELATGDAIVFRADSPHVYLNAANEEAVAYLVMTYTIDVV